MIFRMADSDTPVQDQTVTDSGDQERTSLTNTAKVEAEIVEGEVVNDGLGDSSDGVSAGVDSAKSDEADLVLKLEGMIKNNNAQIIKMTEELSQAREMLKDAFDNDTTYKEHADAAKDANKVKAATRARIMKQPTVRAIADKVKTLASELKELKEGLSDYLREFNRISGITEIEGVDGELLEIVYVAKLVKRTTARR